jgi:hypothetical protein
VDGRGGMRIFLNMGNERLCSKHIGIYDKGVKCMLSLPCLKYSQRLLGSSCCCYCCRHDQKHRFCTLICEKMTLDHLLFDQEKTTAKKIHNTVM